jgi:hypothetical protein
VPRYLTLVQFITPGSADALHNFRVASAVVASIIFVLAGCGMSGNSVAPGQPEDPDITIAAVPSADLASVYIAEDDGFFAQLLNKKYTSVVDSGALVKAMPFRLFFPPVPERAPVTTAPAVTGAGGWRRRVRHGSGS